jgi:hypothetical protein
LAKKDRQQDQGTEELLARLKEHLDLLDDRLDNVDSIVSAVAERVMRQPVTLNITCSKCGQKIEIALVGIEKPTR